MPPRRRRRVAVATGASMGTLLADIKRDQQQREFEEAKAKAEKREKSSERSRNYARIVTNFVKDRTMTYDEANAALKAALVTEDDPELKGILSDYIDDIKLTKQSRDVNNIVDDYTYGRKTYAQFTSAMTGMDKSNALIAEAISKNLEGARKTENNRLLTKWGADYRAGGSYDQYVRNLNELRSAPDQKDPNDVAAITQHLTVAAENEQQIEDNKQYVAWQGSGDSPSALRYFNQRLVNAKNVKDANTVEQYIKFIQAEDQKQARSAAAEWTRDANEQAKHAVGEMEGLLRLAVAEAQTPEDVVAAYNEFGAFLRGGDANGRRYPGLLNSGAPIAAQYRVNLETLGQRAALDASKVASKMYDRELSELEQQLRIAGLDDQAKAGIWVEIAKKAREAMNSERLMSGHEKYAAWIDKAATAVASNTRTSLDKRRELQTKIDEGLSEVYRSAKTLFGAGALQDVPESALASQEEFMAWALKGNRLPRLVDDLKRYRIDIDTTLGQSGNVPGVFRSAPKAGVPKLNISEKVTSGALDDLPDVLRESDKQRQQAIRSIMALRQIQDRPTTEELAHIELGFEPPVRPSSLSAMDREGRRLPIVESFPTYEPQADPLFLQPTVLKPMMTPPPPQFSETAQYLMSAYAIMPTPMPGFAPSRPDGGAKSPYYKSADAALSQRRAGGTQADIGEESEDTRQSKQRGGLQVE